MNKLEQQDQKLSQILDAIKTPAANLDGGLDAICLFPATNKQTNRQIDRQTNKQSNIQTHSQHVCLQIFVHHILYLYVFILYTTPRQISLIVHAPPYIYCTTLVYLFFSLSISIYIIYQYKYIYIYIYKRAEDWEHSNFTKNYHQKVRFWSPKYLTCSEDCIYLPIPRSTQKHSVSTQ